MKAALISLVGMRDKDWGFETNELLLVSILRLSPKMIFSKYQPADTKDLNYYLISKCKLHILKFNKT